MKYFYTCLLLLLSLGVFAQVEDDDEVDESTRKEMTIDDNYAKYLNDGIKNDAVLSTGVNLSYILSGSLFLEVSAKIPETKWYVTAGIGYQPFYGFLLSDNLAVSFLDDYDFSLDDYDFISGYGYSLDLRRARKTFGFAKGLSYGLKYRTLLSSFEETEIIRDPLDYNTILQTKRYLVNANRHFFSIPIDYKFIIAKQFYISAGQEIGIVNLILDRESSKNFAKNNGLIYEKGSAFLPYINYNLSFGYLIR